MRTTLPVDLPPELWGIPVYVSDKAPHDALFLIDTFGGATKILISPFNLLTLQLGYVPFYTRHTLGWRERERAQRQRAPTTAASPEGGRAVTGTRESTPSCGR